MPEKSACYSQPLLYEIATGKAALVFRALESRGGRENSTRDLHRGSAEARDKVGRGTGCLIAGQAQGPPGVEPASGTLECGEARGGVGRVADDSGSVGSVLSARATGGVVCCLDGTSQPWEGQPQTCDSTDMANTAIAHAGACCSSRHVGRSSGAMPHIRVGHAPCCGADNNARRPADSLTSSVLQAQRQRQPSAGPDLAECRQP